MVTLVGDGVVMVVPSEVADRMLNAAPYLYWKVADDGKGK